MQKSLFLIKYLKSEHPSKMRCYAHSLFPTFGSAITDMQYVNDTNGSYRYGFNGEEKENSIDGEGMVYDLGARFYDGRLGRMFSTDPLESNYPWQSTYAYCDNSPIATIDIKGMGGGVEDKEITQPNGTKVWIGANIEQTDDKLVLINNPNRPDKTNENDWDYAVWDPEKELYVNKKFECQDVGTVSSVPQYQYGELYETDLGQKTIWPIGSHPTEGFKYIGTGYYSLKDKISVIDLKNAHPDLYHLWLPKTKNALVLDQAFKDGGRDAGIFFVGSIGSAYAISYSAIYASLTYSTVIRIRASRASVKLYSQATYRAFERQLAKDGMKSILKTQSTIERKLMEHIQKLAEIKKVGGYSSSVEREIQTFQSQLEALKDLLR